MLKKANCIRRFRVVDLFLARMIGIRLSAHAAEEYVSPSDGAAHVRPDAIKPQAIKPPIEPYIQPLVFRVIDRAVPRSSRRITGTGSLEIQKMMQRC
jgi:hypothetical protein